MFKKSKAQERAERNSFSAAEVANTFLLLAEKDGKKLSNLQLQKLVYIAYGFYLAALNEQLFHDKIEAWPLGPVIPNLYHELKRYGWGYVTEPIINAGEIDPGESARTIIEEVWKSYRDFSAEELSSLTHQPGSPWAAVWDPGSRHVRVPDDVIRTHYQRLLKYEY
jgi:uncharacterized phage-associated protein